MTMTPVQSTCFKAIGYDKSSQVLRLQFQSGGTHDFADVPPEKHRALMAADSHGRHFHKHINGKHESTPVDES